MAAKRDRSSEPSYAERVAEKLIEQLQQGTAPWQKPWKPGELRAPYNPATEKPYRGFNSIWLMAQGHGDPRWMTYKQAAAAGCQVRKGEKGTYIQYVKMQGEEPITDDNGRPVLDDQGKPKTQMVEYERPRVFGATVFNGSQIDGLPELKAQTTKTEWARHELAEAIMQASGVPIHHQPGDHAYYRPSSDSITLPHREQFATADGYYATALHELGHATGHPSRLNRDLADPFGSEGYAKEELRAEIASLMLGERLELGHDPGQHAAYVGSWIKVLQDDPREIMRAAADAEKIASFVQGWAKTQDQDQSNQPAPNYPMPPDDPNELRAEANRNELATIQAALTLSGPLLHDTDHGIGRAFMRLIDDVETNRPDLAKDAVAGRDIFTNAYADVSEDERLTFIGRDIRNGIGAAAENHSPVVVATMLGALSGADRPNLLPYSPDELNPIKASEVRQDSMTPEEAKLRALWTAEGVPADRQNELISQIEAAAAPGARIGPFTISDTPVQHHAPENPMSGRTYLAVPFREKDEAKRCGAKWDKEQKSWFAPEGADMSALAKWLPENRKIAVPIQSGDPVEEFGQALKSAGLILDGPPVMDGKRQRAPVEGDKGKELSGSYIGYLDGHPAGSIQNYKTGLKETWKSSAEAPSLSDADRARLAEEAKQRQEQRAAALEKEHQATSDRLTKALADPRTYTAANPDHPYLRKKELGGDAGGLMQDQRGNLIVPAKDATGKVHTVQWIAPDGTKGFAKGGKLEGAFHIRNGDKTDGPIFIGEGVATMETIGRATGATTVAAFTAANLGHVAKAIRAEHPDRPIVIAGDNDHHQPEKGKPNVGRETAERVAKQVNGHAAIPEFSKDSKGTDWNDFAAEKGVGELQKAMNESMVMADRRRLNDAQMLGTDGERVEEIVRQNQAKAEQQKGPNVADIKSAYADLRLKAGKEADRQDKSDEAPKQDQEQEQEHQQTQVRSRGTGRSRTR